MVERDATGVADGGTSHAVSESARRSGFRGRLHSSGFDGSRERPVVLGGLIGVGEGEVAHRAVEGFGRAEVSPIYLRVSATASPRVLGHIDHGAHLHGPATHPNRMKRSRAVPHTSGWATVEFTRIR